ncbi:MAG: hypothetical protein AAB758_02765 [Patescibacteria group bacterium]
MKLSKVLHIASIISGALGVLALFGVWGGGMMSLGYGMMGNSQGFMSMSSGSIALLVIAIWFQLGAIHHMMLEKRGEVI